MSWVALLVLLTPGADVTTKRLHGYTGMTNCRPAAPGPVNRTTALAVFPSDASATKTYPLLAFAHGMGCATSIYTDMLTSIAAHGYIAIAPDSDENNWCERQYKDQIHGIDIAYEKRAEFPYSAINWTAGVGLIGHSMGAHATVQSAGIGLPLLKSPVKVKAAIAFAPQEFGTSYANDVKVPIFYISATGDGVVPAAKVSQQYDDTTTSKVFAELVGYNHMALALSDTFSYFSLAFFNCHIRDTLIGGASCNSIYDTSGHAWCPLCGNLTGCPHPWPMKVCKHSKQ